VSLQTQWLHFLDHLYILNKCLTCKAFMYTSVQPGLSISVSSLTLKTFIKIHLVQHAHNYTVSFKKTHYFLKKSFKNEPILIIGRPYYRSSLWHDVSSVCLSVVCPSSVCNVLYCGKTVRPSEKVSEGVNRKPGSKSSFFGSPPYFYFWFRRYGHQDGRFLPYFCSYSPAIGTRL